MRAGHRRANNGSGAAIGMVGMAMHSMDSCGERWALELTGASYDEGLRVDDERAAKDLGGRTRT
eukprot:3416402-Rhodomonas_salina.2